MIDAPCGAERSVAAVPIRGSVMPIPPRLGNSSGGGTGHAHGQLQTEGDQLTRSWLTRVSLHAECIVWATLEVDLIPRIIVLCSLPRILHVVIDFVCNPKITADQSGARRGGLDY